MEENIKQEQLQEREKHNYIVRSNGKRATITLEEKKILVKDIKVIQDILNKTIEEIAYAFQNQDNILISYLIYFSTPFEELNISFLDYINYIDTLEVSELDNFVNDNSENIDFLVKQLSILERDNQRELNEIEIGERKILIEKRTKPILVKDLRLINHLFNKTLNQLFEEFQKYNYIIMAQIIYFGSNLEEKGVSFEEYDNYLNKLTYVELVSFTDKDNLAIGQNFLEKVKK